MSNATSDSKKTAPRKSYRTIMRSYSQPAMERVDTCIGGTWQECCLKNKEIFEKAKTANTWE